MVTEELWLDKDMQIETSSNDMSGFHAHALKSNAWPFVEARALCERVGGRAPEKGYVLFETGYGPSGLPHVGTFGEVARTSMVRHAFSLLSGLPTRLLAFSDDMDGLRKVPDNIPNREQIIPHLGKPLTAIPDPYGTHDSFGHHNNARLRAFLDAFGFDYEFVSATEYYRSGRFDRMLRRVLEHYEEIVRCILPTLGQDRRATYSPFLPICPATGRVLQVRVLSWDPEAGTIVYESEQGPRETPVTGGQCKLQWKVDWAMRWAALGVDYEMWGKDLIDSARLSDRICRILSGNPPVGFAYELFLDERGEKISKSKGNGLSMEEWLRYAPPESLALFMYQKPRTAKRLFFDVIPKAVDEYLVHLDKFPAQEITRQIDNPVWHIHQGAPPQYRTIISYSVLLNLASACHTEDKSVLWHFISRYRPDATPENAPILDHLVEHAINYYRDFVKPTKNYRTPTSAEKQALSDLSSCLATLPPGATSDDIQTEVYEVGKRHHPTFPTLRDWFRSLYQILLGQDEGPRMGSFIALFGTLETISLIEKAVSGKAVEGELGGQT